MKITDNSPGQMEATASTYIAKEKSWLDESCTCHLDPMFISFDCGSGISRNGASGHFEKDCLGNLVFVLD